MNSDRQKRLDVISYRRLWNEVLKRDSWRCQNCGAHENLQVHHCDFRSRGGSDTLENLVTLCVHCHNAVHGPISE
jgi:5-methylcytosine-specific restriction endonuclease McrA